MLTEVERKNRKKKRKEQQKNNPYSEYWRKKAVTVAKKVARMQAGFKCAYCGMGEPQRLTHGSHIYSEGKNPNMSADVDNILCLCWLCHMGGLHKVSAKRFSWHGTPREAQDWFEEKYPRLHQELRRRSQDTMKIVNWKQKFEENKKLL